MSTAAVARENRKISHESAFDTARFRLPSVPKNLRMLPNTKNIPMSSSVIAVRTCSVLSSMFILVKGGLNL